MTSFCIAFTALFALGIVAIPAVLASLMLEAHRRRHAEDLCVPSMEVLAPLSVA